MDILDLKPFPSHVVIIFVKNIEFMIQSNRTMGINLIVDDDG